VVICSAFHRQVKSLRHRRKISTVSDIGEAYVVKITTELFFIFLIFANPIHTTSLKHAVGV